MMRILPYMLLILAAPCLAPAAAETPELEIKPCTIELVDGTKVEGHLAVQFDMPDHLIVYSPRLATVRSFLKDHVHALTVDGPPSPEGLRRTGKREKLNPKRELTDADKQLLGQVAWPAEPPAKAFKPDYTTETWAAPQQLLVWANPNPSGHEVDWQRHKDTRNGKWGA